MAGGIRKELDLFQTWRLFYILYVFMDYLFSSFLFFFGTKAKDRAFGCFFCSWSYGGPECTFSHDPSLRHRAS